MDIGNPILNSRVLIIEGISGSGKDTFQNYLREKLDSPDLHLHVYSEGEVLHSWKHLQIEGILLKVRIEFMKHFLNYVRDVVDRDANAVFLLNRFHLSTYVSTVIPKPELKKEYDEIIEILRTLPVHVFLLQVDGSELRREACTRNVLVLGGTIKSKLLRESVFGAGWNDIFGNKD